MDVQLADVGRVVMPGILPDKAQAVATLCQGQGAGHEEATLYFAAARIAALLGIRHQQGEPGATRYWLPLHTLLTDDAAAAGILDESHLWGGVVPFPFVATKLVSHPLWQRDSVAPLGWRAVRGIEECTLPGYSVFSHQDAEEAGLALLRSGDVRLKCPFARGGHGQVVVRSGRELVQWLQSPASALVGDGLVVERHLVRSITYSVGGSSLPGHEIAYHGEQRNVTDPGGAEVYGGSVLTVRRGDLSTLCADVPEGELTAAVRAATRYDRAVRDAYGVIASRRNYDVIAGVDSRGQHHLGVLEQSWRFGGASMAEVLAMERLAEQPGLCWVIAEAVESYGDAPDPPGAAVYWQGDMKSPRKYARIVRDGR